ncbi:MAG: hypothetical protein K0S08_976 [Gammaproteobacteria bacterium]|jgi:hypothetical protein|nr:hypothetical protein [Gammaproteobacteria bacterium]
MMTEIVTFKLKAGTDEAKFITNVTALIDDFIAKQKGFLKVQLGKSPATNEWVAVHYFDNMADDDTGIKNTRSSEIWKQDTVNIDPMSITRNQYNIVIP